MSTGGKPAIRVVEYCTDDRDVSDAEDFWIKHFRLAGCPLTNHKEGGFNGRPDEETKKRISTSLTGHVRSAEVCQRMSAAKLGDKNPMFGKPVSEGTRDKRAESMSGEKNHRFGMAPPVESVKTRFRPGQTPWNKGLPGLSGADHPMFGKRHTEESKRQMSESRKGQPPWNAGKTRGEAYSKKMSELRTGTKMRCSICSELGHNKQTCSSREVEA